MMKFKATLVLLFCFSVFLLSTLTSLAADATFSWVPNDPEPSGYKIYYGIETGDYSQVIDIPFPVSVDGKIIETVTGLEEGETYYFAATAYSDNEESDYTDEVIYTVPGTPVSEPPVVSDISLQGDEDNPLSGQLVVDDGAGTDSVFSIFSGPLNGTLTVNDNNGTFTYTPSFHFSGVDTFVYSASNAAGTSAPATVTLNINSVNDLPVANSASIATTEDSSVTGQLTASDIDGNALSFSIVTQPTRGSVSVSSLGAFTYTPNQDVFGSDSFTFRVNDGSGDSNIATVNVSINPVNDIPVANSTSVVLPEDSSVTGQLTASDSDGDSLSFSVVTQPARGSVSVNQAGSFTYTPNHDVSGSDSFTYQVNDGSSDSNIASVHVTILNVNESPVAYDSTFVVDAGNSYSGQLTATDDENALVYSLVSIPQVGSVSIAGDGAFTYSPESGSAGVDSFSFVVTDGSLESNTATVSITINEVENEFAFEVGELLVTSDWQQVDFSTTFINPSVIAKSTTTNDQENGVISIRNISNTGFDIRIQEWDYLDGIHPEEIVSFLAMERGHHQIAGEVYAVADCATLSGLNNYTSIAFTNPLSTQPVVLSSVVSATEEADAVTLRIKEIDNNGFLIAMQEQENNDGVHGEETMCFIAWEEMSGTVNDLMVEIASTGNTLTHEPSTVSFNQHFSEMPFVMAGMQTTQGGNTAVLGLSDLSTADTKMTILEEQSADSEIKHITEVAGYFAIAPLNPSSLSLEVGEVAVSNEPVQVQLSNSYIQPVIIANIVTKNDSEPCVVRVSDISKDGFNVRLQEYGYQDNIHGVETVSYIVMEEGLYTLDDGTQIEAGLFTTSATETSEGVSLVGEFAIEPVVLTSVNSTNDPETVTGRVKNITSVGFQFRLQEQEANAKDHGQETVAYIAWTPGSGVTSGIRFEAGTTTDSVTHNSYNVTTNQSFEELPYHFAAMQTTDGGDTSTLRITRTAIYDLDLFVEEEASRESEIKHTKEIAGYLVILPE